MRRGKLLVLAAVVAVILTACSSGGGSLDVSLYEWGVDPSASSVEAGEVEFNATNDGGEPHELVIVKGMAPADLPVDEDGKVIEDDLPEGAFIGEIEEFDAGLTESATFDLEAGTYTLFCNIVEIEDGEPESHFQEGMVTTITVTG
jgi:plastocyanin